LRGDVTIESIDGEEDMLLTISTTKTPATDLGYLLHKNPARVHDFNLSFGRATVFYPEATSERCTVCLLVEVDPIGLVRRKSGPVGDAGMLAQYVNDRPYVASSFLSVAISEVFGTALGGRSKDRQELAEQKLPFEVSLPVLPSRAGEGFIRALFEPLGYVVSLQRLPLDVSFPEWGASRYYSVTLIGQQRLQDLLSHINVLIPVLDDEKHYWVGDDEVEKLLRRGGEWLPVHPAKEQIARRYLKHRKSLAQQAIERLATDTDDDDADDSVSAAGAKAPGREEALESRISLNTQRLTRVAEVVQQSGTKSVVDLGCGEGKLLRELMGLRQLERIVGMDVSVRSLEFAHERLRLEQLGPTARERIQLIHGSLMYRDRRLQGFEIATVIEVVEHLDAARLQAFERVLFGEARPKSVVLTTPNAEYNVKFETLPAGQFRHPDHRFEWTRVQFQGWAQGIAERFGYVVRFDGIGENDAALGAPTQMAVFEVR
jgi:3' terminal RNA ribose 2'-O-methyltransferase Hen1